MRILLTGFDRFGELDVNPTQIIVQSIAERARSCGCEDIVTEILRTEFAAAGDRIRELIHQVRPEALVSLGLAPGLGVISLERVALNLDDADAPDNAGEIRADRPIVPNGPVAYWSTLPLERMRNALQDRRIPVTISNHAGTYVCNHVFYVARREIERLESGAKCGFIHLPLMSEQVKTSVIRVPNLPLSVMLKAIECCLEVLQEETVVSPKLKG